MTGLKYFWRKIKDEIVNDKAVVLAVIIEKKGSAPRGAGAHMLVLQSGETIDTIGGGILEHLAVEQAKKNLREKISSIREFSLDNKTAAQIGMVCGGRIKVLLQYLDEKNLSQIETAVNLLDDGRKFIMKTTWKNEAGTFDFAVTAQTKENEMKHKTMLEINETGGFYAETFKKNPVVYLFGGGYVAQETAKLLPNLEFDYVVIEERAKFADRKFFPQAKDIIITRYEDFSSKTKIAGTDFAVVITSGHEKDTVVLEQLLRIKPAYIGAIGSRHKKAHVENFLQERGFSEAEIKTIVMPIGLDIKAETPAEIAVSIAAQLIQKRAR